MNVVPEAAAAPETTVTYRPTGARIVAIVAGSALLAVGAALWASLSAEVRATFSWWQVVTLLLFLTASLSVLHGIARTRVRADETGLEIVNGYRSHAVEWAQIVAIGLPRGAPWAVIDTADGSVIAAMALQSSDGPRARAAVLALRRRVDALGAPDPET